MTHRILTVILALFVFGCLQPKTNATPETESVFTDAERAAIVRYWNAPGRYLVEPYGAEKPGITAGGSTWQFAYNALLAQGRAKLDPAIAWEPKVWESWLAKRIAWDKAAAGAGPSASPPGPIPPSLSAALGEPPPFYARYRPQRYTVAFAPEDAPAPYVYTEHNTFTDRYPSYRSPTGVMRIGRRLSSYEGEDRKRLDALFEKVGGSAFERKVLTAVSRLEGGFEAVNTYDTGYISIGFLQFTSARDGNGSLSGVLLQHRTDDFADFRETFHRFGIDVSPPGILVVVDPATGEELWGPDAVLKVIEDKRLTAVFERAGGRDGFRLAQLRMARARYWPGDDPVRVTVTVMLEQSAGQSVPVEVEATPGASAAAAALTATAAARQAERRRTDPEYRCWTETRTLTARVGELVQSEAGMATLMDRKVHRGNIRMISDVAVNLMRAHSLTRLEDLRTIERRLVEEMRHRADFLSDRTPSQPAPAPPAGVSSVSSGRRPEGRRPWRSSCSVS